MHKGIKVSIIIFVLLEIVILAGFFLLDFEHSTINILALCFLELSLLISMISSISIAKKKKSKDTLYYNAGISSITVVYQIAVIISVTISKTFENNIKGFLFLQIVINAFMFIVCVLIIAASRYIHKSNEKTLEMQNNGEFNKPKRGGF